MNIDGNAPAFPNRNNAKWPDGITVRAYYAGLAMQGMLSCQDFMNDQVTKASVSKEEAMENVARWSRMAASKLIAELNKDPEDPFFVDVNQQNAYVGPAELHTLLHAGAMEQMEWDCRAVCLYCNNAAEGIKEFTEARFLGGGWVHTKRVDPSINATCNADPIRRRAKTGA